MTFISSFIRNGTPGPDQSEWLPYFKTKDGNTIVAPYYEIGNEYKQPEHFKFNLKQLECQHIWK